MAAGVGVSNYSHAPIGLTRRATGEAPHVTRSAGPRCMTPRPDPGAAASYLRATPLRPPTDLRLATWRGHG